MSTELSRHTNTEYLSTPKPEQTPASHCFEKFIPFITVEKPESKEHEAFAGLLAQLFKTTGSLWYPGQCTYAPLFSRSMREYIDVFITDAIVVTKLTAKTHVWSEIVVPGKSNLIVDPAGIPEHPKDMNILPHFGPAYECALNGKPREYAQTIYTQGQVMDQFKEDNYYRTFVKYVPTNSLSS